ncbi:MAG: DUF4381 family protein [Verrucomicrobiota bacterium]
MTTNTASSSSGAASLADGLRDIKPPVEIWNPWLWAAWVGAALLLLGLLALLLWIRARRRKAARPGPPPEPAHRRALRRLDEALAMLGEPKPFCIRVSDTLRVYLEERFDFRAPERTTEEFLQELHGTPRLSVDQKGSLGRFLEQCDLVKFARYEPGEPELRQLHAAAVGLVHETQPQETVLTTDRHG